MFSRLRHALPDRDELVFDGAPFQYAIRVSPRRRDVCVQVYADGRLRVVAPPAMSLPDIRAFIIERAHWIRSKQTYFATKRERAIQLIAGAALPFAGEQLRLEIHPRATRARAIRKEKVLAYTGPEAGVRAAVIAWYRRQATETIAQRIAHYAPAVGCKPTRLVIRDQRTRWGSCSARGTISINWRLLLAPYEVMDYVVIHELCHLLQRNHSVHFWREVERVMPSYEQHTRWLRERGGELSL